MLEAMMIPQLYDDVCLQLPVDASIPAMLKHNLLGAFTTLLKDALLMSERILLVNGSHLSHPSQLMKLGFHSSFPAFSTA